VSKRDIYLSRLQQGGETEYRIRLTIRYLLMVLVAVIMLGPFLWLFYLSVRIDSVYTLPTKLADFSFSSYARVWTYYPIGLALRNSAVIALTSVVLTVLIASLAAYPLARFDFYGRNFIFLLILSTLMIPFQLYMIPLYILTGRVLHLDNSMWGVVLPFTASAFGIYLVKQFYAGIPRDMEEAARADGAGEFRVWWQVMFPLTKPAVATLAIFTFVGSWSAFLWPLIVLQDDEKSTLPVAVARLTGAFVERTSDLAAGSVIAVVPVILLFVALQRWFLGGITIGAVKG
jgi:putative chitobiose transport system permease protein